MNRNYPRLLDGQTNCLLCNSVPDSNQHLWNCPELYEPIKNVFTNLASQLISLLNQHADKLTLCIPDSVKFSPTFHWAHRNPNAILLLRSYVTNDLYKIFSFHITRQQQIFNVIFPFLQECSQSFKKKLWKFRNEKWKSWRDAKGLTKRSFKIYSQLFGQRNQQHMPDVRTQPRRRKRSSKVHVYSNPQWDFRNYKNHQDFLFILFSSSNFLHGSPFYSHIDLLTSFNIDDLKIIDEHFISFV